MNDVSEAEIEAAARGLLEVLAPHYSFDALLADGRESYRVLARAALTAAAQVRERADREEINKLRLLFQAPISTVEYRQIEKNCDFAAFQHAWSALVKMRLASIDGPSTYASAVSLGPIPIYGATEPDQGEDVLGIRKGEG